MPGLKTGVENDIFWSEIRSRFEEPGSTSPPRIPRSNPRVTRVGKKISINCLNGGGGESGAPLSTNNNNFSGIKPYEMITLLLHSFGLRLS